MTTQLEDGSDDIDLPMSRLASAAYVARMLAELGWIAQREEFDFLSYLMGMAEIEARLNHGRLKKELGFEDAMPNDRRPADIRHVRASSRRFRPRPSRS